MRQASFGVPRTAGKSRLMKIGNVGAKQAPIKFSQRITSSIRDVSGRLPGEVTEVADVVHWRECA